MDECEAFYEGRTGLPGVPPMLSVHSVYTVSEPLILWGFEYARKRGLKIHVHLSETINEVRQCREAHGGLSPVEYLDRLGVLGPDVVCAHSLWLSDTDIAILGRHAATCVHNVNSNLKLASGWRFPYNELRDAGANVCLGTDGAASSNNLDMLEHMKNAALLQKAWRGNPAELPLQELLDCATLNGAKALGLDSVAGFFGGISDALRNIGAHEIRRPSLVRALLRRMLQR